MAKPNKGKIRASDELLGAIHELQAQTLLETLKAAREQPGGAPAALLNAVTLFLKQNEIMALPSDELTSALHDEFRGVQRPTSAKGRKLLDDDDGLSAILN